MGVKAPQKARTLMFSIYAKHLHRSKEVLPEVDLVQRALTRTAERTKNNSLAI